jgi:soluble lytic murein transglycosylase-like protein
MDIVESRLSVVRRNSITRSIIDVVGDLDMTYDESAGFVVLIAIESKFDPSAKSSAGAVGLTQVIPKYAKEFGLKCGVKELAESDLIDPYVNILIGACRYRALLEILGNTSAALVAYNAGLHSNQLQQLKSLRSITNTETSSYVAKWLYLREKADEKTTKAKDE